MKGSVIILNLKYAYIYLIILLPYIYPINPLPTNHDHAFFNFHQITVSGNFFFFLNDEFLPTEVHV